MKVSHIRELIAEWEKAARIAAGKNREMWGDQCTKIWTAELIIGDTRKAGYKQPEDRIKFEGVRRAGGEVS